MYPLADFPAAQPPPAPGRYLPVFPVAEYPVSVGRVDLHRGLVDHLDAALLVRAAERPHPAVDLGKGRGRGHTQSPSSLRAAPRGGSRPSPQGPDPHRGPAPPPRPAPPPQSSPAAPHSPPRDPSGWGWTASSPPASAASWPYWEKGGGMRAGPGPAAGQGLGRGLMGWGGDLRRLHVAESRSGRSRKLRSRREEPKVAIEAGAAAQARRCLRPAARAPAAIQIKPISGRGPRERRRAARADVAATPSTPAPPPSRRHRQQALPWRRQRARPAAAGAPCWCRRTRDGVGGGWGASPGSAGRGPGNPEIKWDRARGEPRRPRGLAAARGGPRGRAGGAPAWGCSRLGVGPELGLQAGDRPCLGEMAEAAVLRALGAPQGSGKPALRTPPCHPGAACPPAKPPYAGAGTETIMSPEFKARASG